MIENINWYPGHMKKTRELIAENLKMVDIVIEVIDARIPISSRNPIIDELVKTKKRIIILNKSDLSDGKANAQWSDYFKKQGSMVLAMNCMSGGGVNQLYKILNRLQDEKNEGQIRKKPLRMMIVGVPNVGKSSLINRLAGAKKARTEDRPGVTLKKQWIKAQGGLDLLDMPGVLWPKFEEKRVGENLALTGAIRDAILDTEGLAVILCNRLRELYPDLLCARYKLGVHEEIAELTDYELFQLIGRKRGFLVSGGEVSDERTAVMLLDEFRGSKIGRISLERPMPGKPRC